MHAQGDRGVGRDVEAALGEERLGEEGVRRGRRGSVDGGAGGRRAHRRRAARRDVDEDRVHGDGEAAVVGVEEEDVAAAAAGRRRGGRLGLGPSAESCACCWEAVRGLGLGLGLAHGGSAARFWEAEGGQVDEAWSDEAR